MMALVAAKTPQRAAHRLRHRLGTRLPIDVITTHYPDASHSVLLNVAFPPVAYAALTASARRAQQTPERFLELTLHQALAEHADHLQVKASRGIDSNAAAARAWRRAGWAFLAGLSLIGFASRLPGWGAVLLILLGVGVHTLGELLHAAGSFELRYNLAPAHAQG
ncbi:MULTISPECIES: hypothetical protein [Streptomyces]|uniref:hypothetical protein n=1 Tax=Streptomyces TaxID=1883 RepID=UPI0027DAB31D|nr:MULTISPECIES: hypothetical protein [Streptomyces]